jgi:YgiT-type zinc finger domain-containing protein
MKAQLRIKTCPTCGSVRISKVKKNWRGKYHGRSYSVRSLSFYECSDCGERVYDRYAMRRIQENSPAFRQSYKGKAA